MNANVARQMGSQISALIKNGQVEGAVKLITPTLLSPTPFSTLDRIGEQVGSTSLDQSEPFFNHLAARKYMGSWVIIASALQLLSCQQNSVGPWLIAGNFIIQADVWYATDTFGERVVRSRCYWLTFIPHSRCCLPGERIQTAGCGDAWEWRCICGPNVLAVMLKWWIEPWNCSISSSLFSRRRTRMR